MVERCSNGVAFLVLEPEPSVRTGIRVDIFEGDDPSTIIARLPLTWGRKWTDPLKGAGSGEFWIHALDETLAANPGILDYGNIARFSLDEIYRFAIQIEKLDRVQVKAGGDVERTIKVSGRGVLSKLEEVVVYPAGGLAGDPVREFTDATSGEILGTLFDEAQTRGALTGLTRSFTNTDDSNNAPHNVTLTLSERAGTSLLRIADRLGEMASDVYMTPNGDLKLVNQRGIDRSQQLPNTGPIILQPADNLSELTRSESGSIRNILLIETPAGFLERSRGASVSAHGHREAFLSLGNISDTDAVDRASEAVFAKSADPAAEIGASVLDKEGARPYVDWGVGDWVLAPNDDDELERLRVRALTVSETAEGQPIFTPDLATITEELEQRLERWLAAMSKGTVGGTAGEVAEPVKAPVEVVDAIDAGLGDHLAAQPHFDELADLSDTDVAGLADNDVLRYDSADGAWEPEALDLDSLDDVDVTTTPPSDGNVLTYDDGAALWKPGSSGGGGGAAAPTLPLDVAPSIPSAWDDEFDGSSLDAKWTDPTVSGLTIDTAVENGWLVLEPSAAGTGTTGSRGGYGIRQAAPSGDFEVMAKVVSRRSAAGTDDARAGIFLGAVSGFGYIMGPQDSADRRVNQDRFSSYSRVAAWGGFSSEDRFIGYNALEIAWVRAVYDRTAGTIGWYWSLSGVSWQTSAVWTSSSVPDIDDIGIAIWANSGSPRADRALGIDWFRVVEL